MAYTLKRTEDALRQRFQASQWEPITLTLKDSGDVVTITPCIPEQPEAATISEQHCSWFLIKTQAFEIPGGESLSYVANIINNWEETKKDEGITD